MTRDELHTAALALPGATMNVQWGDDCVYKVGGKMFAATDGAYSNLSFKATDIAFEALTETGRARPAPYMARNKWVNLPRIGDWPDDELAEHLAIAHGIVAAKLTKKARAALGL